MGHQQSDVSAAEMSCEAEKPSPVSAHPHISRAPAVRAPSGGSYRVELKSTGQTVVANSRTQKQILENAERIIAKADAKTGEGAKSPKRSRWQKLLGR